MNQLLRESYRMRGSELASEAVVQETQQRSAAGPGKWARAAAKGGYPFTTLKHLRALMQSDAKTSYKSRMVVEAVLRLVGGVARRSLSRERSICVPQFPRWEEGWARELSTANSAVARVA